MGTGIAIGIGLCLFVGFLVFLGRRAWRKTLPPATPQPPVSGAQLANQAVLDAEVAYHPQVVSMRFRRRTRRGRSLRNQEENDWFFEH